MLPKREAETGRPIPRHRPDSQIVEEWLRLSCEGAGLESIVATKNKGGRAAKKPAAKSLKEKRAAKKSKQK